ncbi:uncharacterized protein METZ01_LOCUS460140 [marine metagenome]|uniref:Phosphoribosyltransferase domain-containing protein n=1 Tax=marine metagenome TaxID=408172 RepID=A0A383AHB3_9ZZZZ
MSKAVKLDLNIRPTAIIPVPLHTTKERERGFNQAEIIAKIASRHFKVPIINDLLIRIKATYSQTHLSRSKRMSNVEGAFICARKQIMGSYLLVDDVITTGFTANACAKVLSAHGATLVEVMTITRGAPQFI